VIERQNSKKIAHFSLDFVCKRSVSGGQRSPTLIPTPITNKARGPLPLPAPLGLRGVAVVQRGCVLRPRGLTMTEGKSWAGAKRRSATKRRATALAPCEWDWPPERRYLPPGPTIDIDPPCETGALRRARRPIAEVLIKAMVEALKIAVAVVIFFACLIYVLVRL
jgi:hypothetical protein